MCGDGGGEGSSEGCGFVGLDGRGRLRESGERESVRGSGHFKGDQG